MKLLVLARTSGSISEWIDHFTLLSAAGWQVVLAARSWDDGPEVAELRSRLWHDPAWALTAAPPTTLPFPTWADWAAGHRSVWLRLTGVALSVLPAAEEMLADVAPDAVAVIGDDGAQTAFRPVLAAAARRGVARVMLNGWGRVPAAAWSGDFTDLVVPDAHAVKRRGSCDLHSLGCLVRLPTESAMLAKARRHLLAASGLVPDQPYLLYLRGRVVMDPDPLLLALEAAQTIGGQVVVLPDPLRMKATDPAAQAVATGSAGRVGQFGPSRGVPAALKRGFRVLTGGAALVIGERTIRLLDAAAAGAAVAAVPQAHGFVRKAGQTGRFGAGLVQDAEALSAILKAPIHRQMLSPGRGLAEILAAAAGRPPGRPYRMAYALGRYLPARSAVAAGAAPPVLPAAVVRRFDGGTELELDGVRLNQILEAIAAGTGPILVGPWISEIGFEVLYWIPFVRWFVSTYGVETARLHICSRGGVSGWYADLQPGDYLDIFDLIDETGFRESTQARFREVGGQKHVQLGALDDLVADTVTTRFGTGTFDWLHPQLIYRLFRSYWHGREGRRFFEAHTRPARFWPDSQPMLDAVLPEDFVAVRFYFRPSFPDTPENRAFATRLVTQMAQRRPVVLIDTGLSLDDHEEFIPSVDSNIVRISSFINGRNNLCLQSDVIRRARLFVGTYGGLSYVPPLYGVPAIAISSDPDRFAPIHLETAIRMFHTMGVSFTHLDLRQADALMG